MTINDNSFWKKLILVLLPLFLVGLVNAIIIYDNQRHIEEDMINCQETKVNNDVLLQYIQLHKQIHDAMQGNINNNHDEIRRLERKLDDFITKYLSMNTRGKSSRLIKQDVIYEFYVKNGINPLHVK